jgi:hypothetical protein
MKTKISKALLFATALSVAAFSQIGGSVAYAQDAAEPMTAQSDALAPVINPPIQTVDADPALWVVKDEDTTVYLFGTIHILKPGLSWFDEAIKDAFDKSDELVLEIIEPSADQAQQLFGKYALDSSGKKLRDKLSDKERGNFDASMKEIGLPENAFDPFDPWAAAVTLQVLAMGKTGYDPSQGAETQLTAAAKASGKSISAVETFEGQLKIFDELPQSEQLLFLNETTADLNAVSKGLDALVDHWSKGEEEKLGDLMNEGLTSTELKAALLTRRNAAWAVWMRERLKKPGTTFLAVGAGHLSGSVSLQSLLTAYGIEATRVNY